MKQRSLMLTMPILMAFSAGCQTADVPVQSSRSADQSQQTQRQQTAQRQQSQSASAKQREASVPIVQEELQVGKREVKEGTTRIKKDIVEKPVEKQVQLRDEEVKVERRSMDRPVKDPEKAFQDKTIEMTETKEVPMVKKEARQTGEVVLKKESGQHTETVRDTVRETQVDVQESGMEQASIGDLSAYEADFRRNYESNYADSGLSYDEYRPAYRYGYDLAKDPRYSNKNWDSIEPQAKRNWEEGGKGSWNKYEQAIKYAWQRARQGKG